MASPVTETVELIKIMPGQKERPISPTFRRLHSEEPSAKKSRQPSYKKSISWSSQSKSLKRSTSEQRESVTLISICAVFRVYACIQYGTLWTDFTFRH